MTVWRRGSSRRRRAVRLGLHRGNAMIKRTVMLALMSTLLAASSGCGILHGVAYQPLGPCGPMAGGGACGQVCGEVGCGEMGCGEVDCCEPNCCEPCRGPYRPFAGLACFVDLFRPVTWCGPVCGERYWGDFYGDPPQCWDPCDPCGNYVGGRPPRWPHCPNGRARGLLGWLFGHGCAGGCCGCAESACVGAGCVESCGGCDDCGPSGVMVPQTVPAGCPDCVGRRPSGAMKSTMTQHRPRPHAPRMATSAGSSVAPAPKLLSVTDEAVGADTPRVAQHPSSTR